MMCPECEEMVLLEFDADPPYLICSLCARTFSLPDDLKRSLAPAVVTKMRELLEEIADHNAAIEVPDS